MGPDGRARVLWLAKGLGQGGMERLLVTHARFGDRERFDYRAAYLVDRPHSVVDELVDLDVPVTRLGTGNGADLRWVSDLVHLVRSENIDVVHAHSPVPASIARPVLRVATPSTRLIYTEHNRWDRYSTPTRLANMVTYPLDHQAFAVSDDCRSTIAPRLQRHVETLIHGIDVDAVAAHKSDRQVARAELGIDDGTVVVGTVANLRVQKNYPLLLEVAKRVTDEHPNVVFLSVGQGPLEAELKALHARLGLGDGFRFLGFRSDVHRVMSAFDIFCLSSDHEGLPVALMEALALDLPVVATDVGGVGDALRGDGASWLVPAGDGEALCRRLSAVARVVSAGAERLARDSTTFDARGAVSTLERTYGSHPGTPLRPGVGCR